MSENEPKKLFCIAVKSNSVNEDRKQQRLSKWFVNNLLLGTKKHCSHTNRHFIVLVYVCHVIGSYISFKIKRSDVVLETIILVVITLFRQDGFVVGTAPKLLFDKKQHQIQFAFWLIRSFVIEILKGQIIEIALFYRFIVSSADNGICVIEKYWSQAWY